MKTPLPPDPEEMNDARAEWANEAVVSHGLATGSHGEGPHTQVQDLLCNLMHLCDRTAEVDFNDCLSMARIHYGEETETWDEDGTGRTVDHDREPVLEGDADPGPTPMEEVLIMLDRLLAYTLDADQDSGIILDDESIDLRNECLAVFEKYRKGGK